MIIVLLAILSVVLLASLMIFGIDQRTYEFGMLRALGLERFSLVILLTLQGFIFAICGWCLGLILSWIVTILIQMTFYLQVRFLLNVNYDLIAWMVGLVFGIVLPIVVNMFSIRSALTTSLRDALDLYRRSVDGLTVVIVRLEKLGINQTAFIVAIELSVYGFLFYYVVPYFFFFNRFDLFIYTFNAILLATLISLTIIANILQPLLEQLFVWLCSLLMFSQKPLTAVIWKNLESH